MAELADAADSKSADLRVLGVRLPLPAPRFPPIVLRDFRALLYAWLTGCSLVKIAHRSKTVVKPCFFFAPAWRNNGSPEVFFAKLVWGISRAAVVECHSFEGVSILPP